MDFDDEALWRERQADQEVVRFAIESWDRRSQTSWLILTVTSQIAMALTLGLLAFAHFTGRLAVEDPATYLTAGFATVVGLMPTVFDSGLNRFGPHPRTEREVLVSMLAEEEGQPTSWVEVK
jgi:hypothetical protein